MTDFDEEKNARDCLRPSIREAVTRGDLRPHEEERALDLAVSNWRGQTTAGDATKAAVDAFKKGVV